MAPKVHANGKTTSELEGPDLWSNIRKGDERPSADRGFTKSPLSDATELEPLTTGGGVDQQRGSHETEFNTSTLKRQNQDMHMGGVPGYDYATSPRSLHLNQPPYMYSSTTATSGYHSDTNTASSHEDATSQMSSVSRPTATNPNPLSSFTVPGPPPHYQGRVKISAPTYSPLKRTQGGTVPGPRGRGQPLPVVTPRAPDVTCRGPGDGTSPTSSARTFSAEDLNAEMINLEGLMKDLNAITASELQS